MNSCNILCELNSWTDAGWNPVGIASGMHRADLEAHIVNEVSEIISTITVSPGKRKIWYTFAHVMFQLLEKHQIKYFAHSGTMLGAVRHKGFIPWDDDIDVMIAEEESIKLEGLMADVESYGIRLGKSHTIESGLVQFSPTGKKILGGAKLYMGFDIFIGENIDIDGTPTLHYKSKDFRRWFGKRYISTSDVFPRKLYPFGPVSIWGMNDPNSYFSRSGFKLDEAVIGVHNSGKELASQAIEDLKALNKYPLREEALLSMEAPFSELTLYELDYYIIDKAQ